MLANNQNQEIIFPPETPFIIKELVRKFKLEEKEEKEKELLRKTNSILEKRKIFENFPGRKIAKILKQVVEEEISISNLSEVLSQSLDLSLVEANKLAEELRERILINILPKEKTKSAQIISIKTIKTAPPKIDKYREPIE